MDLDLRIFKFGLKLNRCAKGWPFVKYNEFHFQLLWFEIEEIVNSSNIKKLLLVLKFDVFISL